MSDLISRDYLTHKIQHWKEKLTQNYGENDEYVRCLDIVIDAYICDAPTVDAVEVVRCKDCKRWEYRVGTSGICKRFSLKDHTNWVSDVDFCSCGERKEVSE